MTHLAEPMPLVRHADVEHSVRRLPVRGASYVVLSAGLSGGRPTAAVSTYEKAGGHRVHRARWVMSTNRWPFDTADGKSDVGVLAFDGRRHLWLRSVEDAPDALVEQIERRGRLYAGAAFDLLPHDHLRVRALIRLPCAVEARAAAARAQTASRAPHAALRRPGFILPSLSPVALPTDVAVVDSPRAALYAWLRTTRGIYVPGDRPRASPLGRLRGEPSFVLLVEPRPTG